VSGHPKARNSTAYSEPRLRWKKLTAYSSERRPRSRSLETSDVTKVTSTRRRPCRRIRALFVWGRTHSSAPADPERSEGRREPAALPSLGWSCGIIGLAGIRILVLGLQSDGGKTLKRKQLSRFRCFKDCQQNLLPIMGHPNCRRCTARPCVRREAKGKADSQQLDFQRSFVELRPNIKPPADSESVEASHICGNSRLSENDQGRRRGSPQYSVRENTRGLNVSVGCCPVPEGPLIVARRFNAGQRTRRSRVP